MLEYWNSERRPPLEGRALSRPATTKRGPPKAGIPSPHHSNIPIFQHSIEVIDKPAARGTENKLTGNFFINELNELNELRAG